MKTSDFDFQLPEELIAQTPLERRLRSGFVVRWADQYSNFAPSTTASQPLPLIYVRA
ncbi:MAG: hypothetical protein HFF51_09535, partial [Lawsonibacter sp.]|nr:hypothetical protein [Lawsonibacter sp.]